MRRISLFLFTFLLGCSADERGGPAAGRPLSAFEVASRAFGSAFFDAEARGALLTGRAREAFRLPGLIEPDRYRFLQVAELRRVDDDRREGEVAFAIDGWPAQLAVELTRSADGWRISKVDDAATQQALVDVLGARGLPRARTAEPWPGGLAGRDANGRPTAAALVMVTAAGFWVDGRRVPDEPGAIRSAIADALAARQQLAWVAHATYRPHVAIALAADAPALRHAQIAALAVEAGAEALMLVVRDPQGGPAFLPLAHAEPLPVGERVPPVIDVQQTTAGVRLAVGEVAADVPPGDDGLRVESLRPAVASLQRAEPAAGFLFHPDPGGNHARAVALLDALRSAASGLPIASVAP
ncbi:MAG: hypothetical protein H6706_06510 [Myxococcales bacterium]|nr:hypothetical protein [Myxococcales bacterium]